MIVLEEIQQSLLLLLQPVFDAAGMELIELTVRKRGAEIMVQIIADRPMGGITMEECSNLNRKAVETIDASGTLYEEYSLELSSPGLDRPLKTRKDFLRVMHQEIRFLLTGPVEGKQEHTGVLQEVRDDGVSIETQKYGTITIPIGKIFKAVQVL